MSDFGTAKAEFERLVRYSGLPMPSISPALPTDPCDVTDAHEVRLNPGAATDMSSADHARHVFGHWLADLHGAESYEEPTREGYEGISDRVADFIAHLIDNVVLEER